jgi:hypothetical protein
MDILQDVFNALQAFEITKIDGQPTDDDINKLTTQLTAALVTISTGNGGGKLGHIGIVVPESRYVALSKGIKLDRPVHPGAYPATASDDKKAREREVEEHKAEVIEFETYMACEAWARQAIVKAVDKEWVSKKHDEDIGYQAVEPQELLDLLRDAGGDLDDLEITDLNTKMLEPWDGVEAPVTMFARADKYERQLERHSIPKQPELRLSYAVSTYQTSGQFDGAMREWHAKLSADKTFPNFRVYIQTEFTKMVKRNRSTTGSVGNGIANKATEEKISDAEAQAMVIAEVANVLQAQNAEQMKNMVRKASRLRSGTTCCASHRQPTQGTLPTPNGMPPLQQEARQSRQVLGTGCQQSPQAGVLNSDCQSSNELVITYL